MPSCIYCGKRADSGEHVFPEWLRDHFPNAGNSLHQQSDRTTYAEDLPKNAGRKRRVGRGLLSWKVPIACAQCNNGWMNRIQTAARPAITALLRGDSRVLCALEQQALALWTIMTCISIEFTEHDKRARGIPASEWAALFAIGNGEIAVTSRVFSNWQIAIGHYLGSAVPQVACDHHLMRLDNGPVVGKSVSILIGELLIQAWGNYGTGPAPHQWCEDYGLQFIWPTRTSVSMPAWLAVTDPMLASISFAMRRHIEEQLFGYVTV